MDSVTLHPSSPSCASPLNPISPERINRQGTYTPSCLSPRVRDDPFFSSPHRNSDVQGKVLQFNQLAENMSPKRKEQEAALRRAMLGREEAEAKIKMFEEENLSLKRLVEEGRGRELKIAQRIEDMMEHAQQHKESSLRAQAVYEKEIRRAKKEAFKSSSALVKLQEELKTARNRYTLMREEAEEHKRRLEAREQETFSAQYKLVSVEEELEDMRQQLKAAQQERDALRTGLKEEELARIAAEGRIPLPPPTPNDEFASPRKPKLQTPPRALHSDDIGSHDVLGLDPKDHQINTLVQELRVERRLRQDALETVTFMKLECQLQSCSCRRAEQRGIGYVHDVHFEALRLIKPSEAASNVEVFDEECVQAAEESVIIHPPKSQGLMESSPATGNSQARPRDTKLATRPKVTSASDEKENTPPPSKVLLLSPPSAQPPILAAPLPPTAVSESPSLLSLPGHPSDDCQLIPSASLPTTPILPAPPSLVLPDSAAERHVRNAISSDPLPAEPSSATTAPLPAAAGRRLVTNTVTTKVPLSDPETTTPSDRVPPKFPFSPGATKTREEALASIQKWREGRARARSVTTGSSTTAAQRRPAGGSPMKRHISAPERGASR